MQGEVPLRSPWWIDAWVPIRWAHAELLYQLGQYDEAERWFLANSRFGSDWYLAPRLLRLGQIEDRRGNKEKAIAYYEHFVELWQDCDPEMRPQVDEARARLAALRG